MRNRINNRRPLARARILGAVPHSDGRGAGAVVRHYYLAMPTGWLISGNFIGPNDLPYDMASVSQRMGRGCGRRSGSRRR
jgi:hypothetical protein